MNITEIIKTRRATPPRFMEKREIEKDTVLKLLDNANWAPTHKNTEPWRFKIFTGQAKQNLAKEIYAFLSKKIESGEEINPQKIQKFKANMERAPVVMAVIMERDKAERIPEWEEIAAVSMAVQNMWLTAAEMGLGAFWSTPQYMSLIYDLLNIKSGQKLLGFFFVGHIPMEYPSQGRGDINDKIEWK